MGRLTGRTKDIIHNYYGNKIKKLEEEKSKSKEMYITQYLQNFENDEDVKRINELLAKVNKKYNLDKRIEIAKYNVNYTNTAEYKSYEEERRKIEKERDVLLIELEFMPLNSKEHKRGLAKLRKIVEE